MPFPAFHAARIEDPDSYPKKRYGKDEFGPGIDVIYGITAEGKAEVQAIRFSRKEFTAEQARGWLKKHPEHKAISFEPASGSDAKTQKQDPLDRFQRTLFDLKQDDPGNAQIHYCPTCKLNKIEGHDAILQGLDRKVGKLWFGKDIFEPTVNAWNGIPLIFSKIHPDPIAFDADPEAELTRVNGAITGELSDAALNTVGRARLMVKKNYGDATALRMYDEGRISVETLNRSLEAIPQSLKLIEEGKLSHSSAFVCPDDGESLYGMVKPNHVLDFEETPTDQPVDRMSVILNKQEPKQESKEIENVTEPTNDGNAQLHIGKVISAKNAGKLRSAFDALKAFVEEIMNGNEEATPPSEPKVNKEKPVGEMNKPDGEPHTEKEIGVRQENKMTPEDQKLMDDKDAEIKALKEKIASLEGTTAKNQKAVEELQTALKTHEDAKVQAQKAAFDAQWNDLKKNVIPPAEVKDPADEAKLQKMVTEEPLAFAAKVAGWKKAPGTLKQEGTSHLQGPGGDVDKDAERNRILSASKQRIPGQFH